MASKRIYQDIETSADYYPPTVYSVLTHYASFEDVEDSLSQDFIPVSQAKPNPKLFVVGLLPPTANVTGNLLDRSGSVARTDGSGETLDTGGGGGRLSPAVLAGSGPPGTSSRVEAQATPVSKQGFAEALLRVLPTATKAQAGVLWAQFAGETGEGSSCYGWNLGNVKHSRGSSSNYHALAGVWEGVTPPQAQSLIASGKWVADPSADHAKAVGPGKVSVLVAPGTENENPASWFNAYPDLDTAMVSFVNSKLNGRFASAWPYIENADPDGYARQLGALGYFTAAPDAYANALTTKARIWAKSDAFEKAQAKAGISPTETGASGWQGQGSANAGQAKKSASKQGQDLSTTERGKAYLSAQRAEILETAAALDAMRNLPPLRFLVNPQSFKISSEKVISDGNWGRNGPILEHWGDGQDKVEFSGKLAAFMAIDANSPRTDNESGGSPGLTRLARSYTASYQNFLALWMLYRNNAALYLQGSESEAGRVRLSMLGSMYIYYDATMYVGSFDNFTITESDTAPHTLEYSISFTVRSTFLLDQAPDPRESSVYGAEAQKFFAPAQTIPGSATAGAINATTEQTVLKEEAERRQAEQKDLLGRSNQPTQIDPLKRILG